MKINQIIDLYRIISNYLPDRKDLALGGYPALVLQGVLEEDRETGDLDMAEFIPGSSLDMPTLNIIIDNISTQDLFIRNLSQNLIPDLISVWFKRVEEAYSEKAREKRKNYLRLSPEEQKKELMVAGVNKSSSLILYDRYYGQSRPPTSSLVGGERDSMAYFNEKMKIDYPLGKVMEDFRHMSGSTFTAAPTGYISLGYDTYLGSWQKEPVGGCVDFKSIKEWIKATKASLDESLPSDNTAIGILRHKMVNLSNFTKAMHDMYNRQTLDQEAKSLFNEYLEHIDRESAMLHDQLLRIKAFNMEVISRFFYDNRPRGPVELSEFFRRNDLSQVKIDLFSLSDSKADKLSLMVGKTRCVHYYLILKAKYEYCKNLLTDEESFEKHIKDLADSYRSKRIVGINSPQDVEYLLTNRRNEKTK